MPESRFAPSSDYRVRRHRPILTTVIVLSLVAVIGSALWGAYRLGVRHGGYAAAMARATEAHLRLAVADLRERISELSRRNTLLARTQRIEREARQHLREVIVDRERRIARIEERLSFYRNIVSPAKTDPGLKIRRIKLTAIPGFERSFRYELVLGQLNGSARYVSGHVDLQLDGQRDGEPASISLDAIAIEDAVETYFRFRYFQILSGRIRIPEDFEPGWLHVDVNPAKGRVDPVQETYPWDSLLSGGD